MTKQNHKKIQSIAKNLNIKKKKHSRSEIDAMKIFKHPITKVLIGGLVIYGLLISSTYFVNGYANFIKATKNLKSARNR